jgi:phosphoribosylglycinamide formyltransferase-1
MSLNETQVNRRIVFATNGNGYVFEKCFAIQTVRRHAVAVVSNRNCRALTVANDLGIEAVNLDTEDRAEISFKMNAECHRLEADYILVSNFNRLFHQPFLGDFNGRIFNSHTSILPAFPGHYGFDKSLAYGARVIGNTLHVIDDSVDLGTPVLQSTLCLPYDEPVETTRHRLFLQECRGLIQLLSWLVDERVTVHDRDVRVKDAHFESSAYSPALDDPIAMEFDLPFPSTPV